MRIRRFVSWLQDLFLVICDLKANPPVCRGPRHWCQPAALGYGLYETLSLARKTEDAFTPFWVSFFPNWYKLLSDFTLIKDGEEWKRLCEAENKLPASKFNVFKQGFSFTVIKRPSEDGLLPGLTFWNNRKAFVNESELNEPIIEEEGDEWRVWMRRETQILRPS